MVTWGVTEPTAGAVGTASTYVLGATDWCDSAPASALVDGDERTAAGSEAVDALAGAAAELAVPASAARLGTRLDVGERRSLDASTHRLVATHRADDRSVVATVAFDGAATATRRDDHVDLSFPERTPVTIAVDERTADGDPVTVPPTPSGLAAAITAMSGAHSTDGPGRSHPSNRRRRRPSNSGRPSMCRRQSPPIRPASRWFPRRRSRRCSSSRRSRTISGPR
ncbi:hypothetical protein GJ629_14540 [Halapricum sp. CBA1109]|nr:hypothetical protein [Halapricum sp. CBA1109]